MSDLTQALRLFSRRPLFTRALVSTLALAIGANTVVFTLVRSVLLRGTTRRVELRSLSPSSSPPVQPPSICRSEKSEVTLTVQER